MTPEEVKHAIDEICFQAEVFGEHERLGAEDGRLLRLMLFALPSMVGKRSQEQKFAEIVAKARSGDADAHSFLCLVAGHLLRDDKEFANVLREYISSGLIEWSFAGETKCGKGRRRDDANISRDSLIASAVEELSIKCRGRGLHATRSRERSRKSRELGTKRAESACSIVHKALARLGVYMTEANVEKIWRARSRRGRRRPT